MSFGSYQPFNPTASPAVSMPTIKMDQPNGMLPSAPHVNQQPPLTPQQKVDQSQQSGGILKMRQPPNQFGGKSDSPFFGGGKNVGGPALQPQTMPQVDYRNFQSNMGSTPQSIYQQPQVNPSLGSMFSS